MGASMEDTPAEKAPLLAPKKLPEDVEKAPPPAAKKLPEDVESQVVIVAEPERQWDGHLLAPCGSCSGTGWLGCLFAASAPCLAFGYNAKHGLRGSFLLHALVYFTAFFVARWLYISSTLYAEEACEPLHHHGPLVARPPPPLPLPSAALLHNYARVAAAGEAPVPFHDPAHPHAPCVFHTITHEDLGPACGRAVAWSGTAHILAFVMIFLGLRYAVLARGALRERFNIAGSVLGDAFSWICCPGCALAQETRTLLKNRVREGVWQGPPGAPQGAATSLPVSQPPPVQVIVVPPPKAV